ncbi:Putative DNA helicase (modular protein) [Pseudorhizobium banfieldiae]|uniref:DNA 3'-5' helicase n=1 Tax=Pseudorhizobium banfieldiae TaxID=1125847 RepID=L0NNA9_9HYPH|nr:UvrD-helicase domain-containing protein [Pseudorhizobium banfieldiae]CAD6596320.1 ATP-dependent helicase [arsenite-oxidising bacterium NT-25]CCF21872.1 Putative DNA helicase (modular protein) [Pseudorhizobium banfieldiae]
MERRFISSSIDQLEETLENAIKAKDKATIVAVAQELTFRRVPRARDLARRILDLRSKPKEPQAGTRLRPSEAAPQAKTQPQRKNGRAPTGEQQKAIDAFLTGGSLRINAYAGTGKTSTLELLAHNTNRRGQYIAFNKSIVLEARERFPATVDCSTTHSLAFRSTPQAYKANIKKMTEKVSSQQLAEILCFKKAWRVDRDHSLQPRSQAFLILETIKRFAQSSDDIITSNHVPQHGSLLTASEDTLKVVADFAQRGAQHVWDRMCNPDDPMPLGHDGYLKLWALSKPQMAADFILLDEAQDTNPVVLEVLRQQSAQLIYVGDRYQQIYEWRGAVNAMEGIDTDHTVRLTQSFRFGPEIAAGASRLLSLLGEQTPLFGNPAKTSRIGPCDPDAVLARTNASVMTALIEALNAGKAPHLVGGPGELMEMLKGVQDLRNGTPSTVPDFFGFENWEQVVAFSRTAEGEHLVTFVNLVESRGERQLMWALNRSVKEEDANIILSTAHKAKGREWENVRLAEDFMKTRPARLNGSATQQAKETRGKEAKERDAELRLFYVALTRAKGSVEVPPPLLESLGLTGTPGKNVPSEPASVTRPHQIPQATKPTTEWCPPTDWKPKTVQPPPPSRPQPSSPQRPAKRGFFSRLFGG